MLQLCECRAHRDFFDYCMRLTYLLTYLQRSVVAPSGERLRSKGIWCKLQVELCDPYLSALSVLQ